MAFPQGGKVLKKITGGVGVAFTGPATVLQLFGSIPTCAANSQLYAIDATAYAGDATDLQVLNAVCLGTVNSNSTFSLSLPTGWAVTNGVLLLFSSTSCDSTTKDATGVANVSLEMARVL